MVSYVCHVCFFNIKGKRFTVNYTIETKEIENYDYIILTSSIICHETELKALQELNNQGKKVFVIGIFANVMKEKI